MEREVVNAADVDLVESTWARRIIFIIGKQVSKYA